MLACTEKPHANQAHTTAHGEKGRKTRARRGAEQTRGKHSVRQEATAKAQRYEQAVDQTAMKGHYAKTVKKLKQHSGSKSVATITAVKSNARHSNTLSAGSLNKSRMAWQPSTTISS